MSPFFKGGFKRNSLFKDMLLNVYGCRLLVARWEAQKSRRLRTQDKSHRRGKTDNRQKIYLAEAAGDAEN